MSEKTENNLNVCNYIVAFIDMLGQKDSLGKIPKIVTNDTDIESLIPSLKETYGKRKQVRQIISDYFKAYLQSDRNKDRYNKLSENQKKLSEQMLYPHISTEYWGDSIIFYSKLPIPTGDVNLTVIFAMLLACATGMLISFGGRTPLRGGIEIGTTLEGFDYGIYGSALFGAYQLEKNIANYPRIVIGEELIKLLSFYGDSEQTDVISAINKEAANMCLGMIYKDKDGYSIIDFLNKKITEFSLIDNETLKGIKDSIAKGFQFICDELERFKKERNSKLAFRYQLLKDYYIMRLKDWEIRQ
jgi:hypothetical protein